MQGIFAEVDTELHPDHPVGVFTFEDFTALMQRCGLGELGVSFHLHLFGEWNDQADNDADEVLVKSHRYFAGSGSSVLTMMSAMAKTSLIKSIKDEGKV